MQSLSSKENFFIGLALSNSANYDSSICVLNRNSKIILIDKFYFSQDIDYFFETSPYIKESVICASVAYDNSMLEGKWRIHAKNYSVLGEHFKVNKGNWTNRICDRCSETFKELKNRNIKIIRADLQQLRMSYGLSPYNMSRTSIDCKDLQSSLKIKYGFYDLPENMLPASALEAIICAMFAMDYVNNIDTTEMFEINSIPVLARIVKND